MKRQRSHKLYEYDKEVLYKEKESSVNRKRKKAASLLALAQCRQLKEVSRLVSVRATLLPGTGSMCLIMGCISSRGRKITFLNNQAKIYGC
ncbi:MAG: hypothetical protein LUH22_07365 [Bacteroides sp.]|nr:hypothetical protein [Bacteroides sp.]